MQFPKTPYEVMEPFLKSKLGISLVTKEKLQFLTVDTRLSNWYMGWNPGQGRTDRQYWDFMWKYVLYPVSISF